jgi:hypothetical protein
MSIRSWEVMSGVQQLRNTTAVVLLLLCFSDLCKAALLSGLRVHNGVLDCLVVSEIVMITASGARVTRENVSSITGSTASGTPHGYNGSRCYCSSPASRFASNAIDGAYSCSDPRQNSFCSDDYDTASSERWLNVSFEVPLEIRSIFIFGGSSGTALNTSVDLIAADGNSLLAEIALRNYEVDYYRGILEPGGYFLNLIDCDDHSNCLLDDVVYCRTHAEECCSSVVLQPRLCDFSDCDFSATAVNGTAPMCFCGCIASPANLFPASGLYSSGGESSQEADLARGCSVSDPSRFSLVTVAMFVFIVVGGALAGIFFVKCKALAVSILTWVKSVQQLELRWPKAVYSVAAESSTLYLTVGEAMKTFGSDKFSYTPTQGGNPQWSLQAQADMMLIVLVGMHCLMRLIFILMLARRRTLTLAAFFDFFSLSYDVAKTTVGWFVFAMYGQARHCIAALSRVMIVVSCARIVSTGNYFILCISALSIFVDSVSKPSPTQMRNGEVRGIYFLRLYSVLASVFVVSGLYFYYSDQACSAITCTDLTGASVTTYVGKIGMTPFDRRLNDYSLAGVVMTAVINSGNNVDPGEFGERREMAYTYSGSSPAATRAVSFTVHFVRGDTYVAYSPFEVKQASILGIGSSFDLICNALDQDDRTLVANVERWAGIVGCLVAIAAAVKVFLVMRVVDRESSFHRPDGDETSEGRDDPNQLQQILTPAPGI